MSVSDSRSQPGNPRPPSPQAIRGDGAIAPTLGPRNDAISRQNPDMHVPPPTDHGSLANLKWPFALSHTRPEEGGWSRETTTRELPTSRSMAGVNMRLSAGGVRELHWHKASEWAYMLAGRARITAVDQHGGAFVDDVETGDLWFFPAGIPHSIQGLEPEGCEFLLVFDDGDFSENNTFLLSDWIAHTPREVLAKNFGRKPRDLAERIAERLLADNRVSSVDVAGPGFINLTLKPHVWRDALRITLSEGSAFGRSSLGGSRKINVEYVSANPTGPMHVGHCRGAVFGDALANLLAFAGYEVTREYYINDAGAQVDVLACSVFLRYREALGEDIGDIPEGLYPGDYLRPVGIELAAEYGAKLASMDEAQWLPIVRTKAIAMMMDAIRADLAALNIRFDVYFSERSLIAGPHDEVAATVAWLREMGEVYEGRLPPPKGAAAEDWEDREQTLFRSSKFGDDVDRPLKKSDGSYTYFASDIAYHKSKIERGFHSLIDVWGADHGGYIKRMQAAVRAVSAGKATLDVKIVQLVRLLRNGEPVKMSKRAGEFVTLREVVDEVGKDAVRFDMLYRKNDAVLDFDLAKVIEASRDNPVFYVQYGHARGQSIFRNAQAELAELPGEDRGRTEWLREANLESLRDSGELSLLRKIALYPRVIEAAAGAHEPHRVAFYLYDLASEFHAQWTRGKDLPHLRFIIQNDPETTKARLALVQGIVTVLASGLALLGVQAPDEMR